MWERMASVVHARDCGWVAANPNPAKPDYKFLIAIEPAKADGTRFAIMVKLNYATYKFNKVRVKVKTKPKKKSS